VGLAEILAVSPGERTSPKPWPATLVPYQLPEAAAGPPSHRTQQKEKDFSNTLPKRLKEAEALQKKKRAKERI
jgi:hypothetical protein